MNGYCCKTLWVFLVTLPLVVGCQSVPTQGSMPEPTLIFTQVLPTHTPSTPTSTSTPDPVKLNFKGQLYFQAENALVKLEPAIPGKPLKMVNVVGNSGVGRLLGSIRQEKLLYIDVTQAKVRIKDLQSDQDQAIFRLPWVAEWENLPVDPLCVGPTSTPSSPGDLSSYQFCPTVVPPSAEELASMSHSDCFSWSPDGQWISFVSPYGSLYLSMMEGLSESIRLWNAPSQGYSFGGQGSPTTILYGASTCATWLTSDRLSFLGYTGGFPSEISPALTGFEFLPPDTTFLVELQDDQWIETSRLERPLWDLKFSPDGSRVAYFEYDERNSPVLYLSNAFAFMEQIENLQPLYKVKATEWKFFFSQDGKKLIIPSMTYDQPGLTVIDVENGESKIFDQVLDAWLISEYPSWVKSLFWLGEERTGGGTSMEVGFIGQSEQQLYLGVGDLNTGQLSRYPIDLTPAFGYQTSNIPPSLIYVAWLP